MCPHTGRGAAAPAVAGTQHDRRLRRHRAEDSPALKCGHVAYTPAMPPHSDRFVQPPGDEDLPSLRHQSRRGAQRRPPDKNHRVPRGTAELGLSLMLAALGVLFIATLGGYLLVRLTAPRTTDTTALPPLLYLSTLVIIASSGTLQYALSSVRRERQRELRKGLLLTLLLAGVFLLIQTPAMVQLMGEHVPRMAEYLRAMREWQLTPNNPFPRPAFPPGGLIVFMILLHAAHVVGGVIPLAVVTRKAFAHRYDHEVHTPVRLITAYWHFLDVVWIVMFLTLLLI